MSAPVGPVNCSRSYSCGGLILPAIMLLCELGPAHARLENKVVAHRPLNQQHVHLVSKVEISIVQELEQDAILLIHLMADYRCLVHCTFMVMLKLGRQ